MSPKGLWNSILRSSDPRHKPHPLGQENGNMRAAISTNDVIELPRQDALKTVVDKVKDFFGDAKESFGKLPSLDTPPPTETEDKSKVKS